MAENQTPKVLVLKNFDSDVMLNTTQKLKELGISCEMTSCDAPSSQWVANAIKEAVEKGIQVVIVGMTRTLSLEDVLAAHAGLPVIGVPVDSSALLSQEAADELGQRFSATFIAITKEVGEPGAAYAAVVAARILKVQAPELVITISMN